MTARRRCATAPAGVAVLAARPAAPVVISALRGNGIHDARVLGSVPVADAPGRPDAVHTMDFDDAQDLWRLHTTDGISTASVVVLADHTLDPGRVRGLDGNDLRTVVRGPAAHLGIAVHGLPNLFWTHPPTDVQWPRHPIADRAEYIARCIVAMRRAGCTRIRVRHAVQHESARRWAANPGMRRQLPRPDRAHFELTVAADRTAAHEYSGPAVLDTPGADIAVTATLNGHPDPIDGRYHWYGRLSATDPDALPDPGRAAVVLRLPGAEPAPGRLQERDPWGNLRITGVGRPPFPLADKDFR